MDERLSNQRVFLLSRMATAKARSLTGAALKKLPKAAREDLGLDADTAAGVMAGLAAEHHVTEKRRGKSVSYQITESGAAYVKTLPPYPPPPKVEPVAPAHEDAQLLGRQKGFALFQLFVAKDKKLTGAELKRKLTSAKAKPLAFNPQAIAWVAWLLAGEGSAREQKRGKSASYELTPEGLARLATAEQHPDVELTLTGAALTALTTAARGAQPSESSAESPSVAAAPAQPSPASPAADSAESVLAVFRELLRERYSHTGLVPIHEVRQLIATRHGESAARHDALDPQIRQLRRSGRVRLVSIADQSRATSEQLGQSIPGENEIFFYLGEPL